MPRAARLSGGSALGLAEAEPGRICYELLVLRQKEGQGKLREKQEPRTLLLGSLGWQRPKQLLRALAGQASHRSQVGAAEGFAPKWKAGGRMQ